MGGLFGKLRRISSRWPRIGFVLRISWPSSPVRARKLALFPPVCDASVVITTSIKRAYVALTAFGFVFQYPLRSAQSTARSTRTNWLCFFKITMKHVLSAVEKAQNSGGACHGRSHPAHRFVPLCLCFSVPLPVMAISRVRCHSSVFPRLLYSTFCLLFSLIYIIQDYHPAVKRNLNRGLTQTSS